jgi:UTP--glucose-1-phosphate uridylyltransferase
MDTLARQLEAAQQSGGGLSQITLSSALAELAPREQYLALEQRNSRYDLGVKYGLFTAQLALAMQGADRDEVLAKLVDLLAERDPITAGR